MRMILLPVTSRAEVYILKYFKFMESTILSDAWIGPCECFNFFPCGFNHYISRQLTKLLYYSIHYTVLLTHFPIRFTGTQKQVKSILELWGLTHSRQSRNVCDERINPSRVILPLMLHLPQTLHCIPTFLNQTQPSSRQAFKTLCNPLTFSTSSSCYSSCVQ